MRVNKDILVCMIILFDIQYKRKRTTTICTINIKLTKQENKIEEYFCLK